MGTPLVQSVEEDTTSEQVVQKVYKSPALPITVFVVESGGLTIDEAVQSSEEERKRIRKLLVDFFSSILIPGVMVS